MVFSSFFYHLRTNGLKISLHEWITLLKALNQGLAYSNLWEFYYLSRAILVKSESDFDQFDIAFSSYFNEIRNTESISSELLAYLSQAIEQQSYDQDEVDRRTNQEFDELQRLLAQRLHEQVGAHNGGKRWIGTGGTSPLGNSGYSYTGIRVGGKSHNQNALQVASSREFRDFREDETLELRQFQSAFRRLRQMATPQSKEKTELDLQQTIAKTCQQGGLLHLSFRSPRRNAIKLLLLFDSGGSMEPHAQLCNQLFQSVRKANHFAQLKIYYFHNCPYNRIYKTPACIYPESIDTQWLIDQLSSDYKVIFVGDASMAIWEMRYYTGGRNNRPGNFISGLSWLQKFVQKFSHAIWLNPIPTSQWELSKGAESIQYIRKEISMYPLSLSGIEQGIRQLIASK